MTETKVDQVPTDNKELLDYLVKKGYDPLHEVLFSCVAKNSNGEEGVLRIIQKKDTKRARVLMRAKNLTDILHHHFACPGVELKVNDSTVEYEIEDCSKRPYKMVNVKIDFGDQKQELNQFVEKFKEAQKINLDILSKQTNNARNRGSYY